MSDAAREFVPGIKAFEKIEISLETTFTLLHRPLKREISLSTTFTF